MKIVVAGAGSVGCFVGGALANSGRQVTFFGRERMRNELQANGLHLTDLTGLDTRVGPDAFEFSTDPNVLSHGDIILVTVKSLATREMARLIAAHAKRDARVVSLQNGVTNAKILQDELDSQPVVAAMVGFNVVHDAEGKFHKGTSGDILIGDQIPGLAGQLNTPVVPIFESSAIEQIQWGKLILNLNNALNALSGIPLKTQLEMPDWRRLLADQMTEALAILAAHSIATKPINGVPLKLIPWILRLPTPLFSVVARKMLQIDPQARSSMWEDFEAGRLTEIDEFQGTILALVEDQKARAPVSARIVELVRAAEQDGKGSPRLSAQEIR